MGVLRTPMKLIGTPPLSRFLQQLLRIQMTTALSGPHMPYSNKNGVKPCYEVSGEGYPLVLTHANPFDRRHVSLSSRTLLNLHESHQR